MGRYQVNAATGLLDLVGSSGAGSGTVTSVGGGVGWTPTPDPIVGAGVGNLDIDQLTLEPTLAAGDLFAFVDVSAGGSAIANQRKVKFSDLVSAIIATGGPFPSDCATSPGLTCRAGRTGTTNDTLLSTDALGSLTGSGAAGFGLGLNATSSATLVTGDEIRLHPAATTVTGIQKLMSLNQDLSIAASGVSVLVVLDVGNFLGTQAQWTIDDDTTWAGTALMNFQPEVINPTGLVRSLGLNWQFAVYHPTFTADDADCTLGAVSQSLTSYVSNVGFKTIGSGTLDLDGEPLVGFSHETSGFGGTTDSCTIPQNIGFRHVLRQDAPIDIVDDMGVLIDYDGTVPSGINCSIRSIVPQKVLRHIGPAVFGDDDNPPNSSVLLELRAPDRAFLLTRLTTAQKTGLVAIDGMLVYDTDTTKLNARENGAWVEFQPLDSDLTAIAALTTTGYAVRTGAGTWTTRTFTSSTGITLTNADGVAAATNIAPANDLAALEAMSGTGLVTRTASETYAQRTLQAPAAGLTISNPAGIAGDPTFALANDLAALEGLGSTGIAVRSAADTWIQRSIAVSDTASVDLTITNGDGVSGNPTISATVLPAGVDHGGLGGLADDDHTQYLLLAGRATITNDPTITTTSAGTGTVYGANNTTGNLKLRANSADLSTGTITEDAKLLWWPNMPAPTATTIVADHSPTFTNATSLLDLTNIRFNPTVTLNATILYTGINGAGTFTMGVAPGASVWTLLLASPTFSGGTSATFRPPSTSIFKDNTIKQQTNTTNLTPAGSPHITLNEAPTLQCTAGTPGALRVTTLTGHMSGPILIASNATGILTLTTRRGVWINDLGVTATGTVTVTDNIGVDIDEFAASSGNYTLTNAIGVRCAISSGTNRFSFRDTGGAAWHAVGKFTTYNNVATAGNGLPIIVALDTSKTNQTAAIGATTVYAVPAAGVGYYRVSWVASINRAATTSSVLGGTNGFQVTWTDAGDSVVKTSNPTTVTAYTSGGNTTATTVSGSFSAYCKASTNLQYAFDYTSVGATPMRYDLRIVVEYLG